ncbi:hypothetical protein JW911_04930 [Candidatus Peregrinibacteria bacterium]|nr:hypothetical protein [Candidatus Peregrinibacteria bacterium]
MMLVWITGFVGLVSIIFCLLSVKLLYRYINRYRFDESKYTLLFGFFRLRLLAGLYVLFTFGFAIISCIFIVLITL